MEGWGDGLREGEEEDRGQHGADEGSGLRLVDRHYTFSGSRPSQVVMLAFLAFRLSC